MICIRPWHKALIVGTAAISAFGLGALMRTPFREDGGSSDVVAPVLRKPTVAPVLKAKESDEPSDRLVQDVYFNPFAPLTAGAPATLGQPKTAALKPVKQIAAPLALPPPPMAPPLPFVAVGSLSGAEVTGGEAVAFLLQQDQLHLVRVGQTVGNTYRVEAITAQKIDLMYLPLLQRQSLQLAP